MIEKRTHALARVITMHSEQAVSSLRFSLEELCRSEHSRTHFVELTRGHVPQEKDWRTLNQHIRKIDQILTREKKAETHTDRHCRVRDHLSDGADWPTHVTLTLRKRGNMAPMTAQLEIPGLF